MTKAMGSDNPHPTLLKMSALLIFNSTASLFRNCLSTSIIRKLHKITPIPNYRLLTLSDQNYHQFGFDHVCLSCSLLIKEFLSH